MSTMSGILLPLTILNTLFAYCIAGNVFPGGPYTVYDVQSEKRTFADVK